MAAKKAVSKPVPELELENDVIVDDELEQDDEDETSIDDIEKKRIEAQAEIDKQLQAKKLDTDRKFVSEDEVNARIQAAVKLAMAELKSKSDEEDYEANIYDPTKPRIHEVTVPRYDNKFIVAFGNLNKDEYNPDLVIKSIDMYNKNETTGAITREPWVEVVFEDGEKKMFPLNFIYKQSSKVACEIVEKKEEDISYDFGVIPQKEIESEGGVVGYGMKPTGQYIKAKVVQKKITLVVKDPRGNLITVEPDVVNWSQVKTRR